MREQSPGCKGLHPVAIDADHLVQRVTIRALANRPDLVTITRDDSQLMRHHSRNAQIAMSSMYDFRCICVEAKGSTLGTHLQKALCDIIG